MAKLTGTRRAARLVKRAAYLMLAPWLLVLPLVSPGSLRNLGRGYGLAVDVYQPQKEVRRGNIVTSDWLGLGRHVGLETATLDVDGTAKISDPYHALAFLLNVYPAIAVAIVGIFVILVARRIEQGRPFNQLATTSLAALGALCGAIGLLVNPLRAHVASAYISQLGLHSTESVGYNSKHWAYDPGSGNFSWPWLALALCLIVLAVAFRVGRQAERDTEGLV